METLPDAIAELRGILAAHPLLDVRESSTGPGEWTRSQVLGHLLDSASNNHQRFVRAQLQDPLSLPGYTQDEWVSTQHYKERPWDELVAFWTAYNRHLLHLMEWTPASRLRTLCRIGDADPVTLEFLMVDYVRHLQHHLQKLCQK